MILVTHNPEIAAVTPRRIEIRNGKIAERVDARLAGLDRIPRWRPPAIEGTRRPRMTLWNAIVVGLKGDLGAQIPQRTDDAGHCAGRFVAGDHECAGAGHGEWGAQEALVAVGGLEKIRVEAQPVPVEQRHLRDFATGVTLDDVRALRAFRPGHHEGLPEFRFDTPPTLAAEERPTEPG